METPMIILSVILVIVLYVLYQHFNQKKTKLGKARNLGETGSDKINEDDAKYMKFEKLPNPSSPNYYILYWLYVEHVDKNSFDANGRLLLYKVGKLQVLLNKDGALEYSPNDGTDYRAIVTSFPLQQWTCVIISIDSNQTVDCYLNGKLVQSRKETTSIVATTKSTEIIESQYETSSIKVGALERKPVTMDPGTAWNKYMEGNGGNFLTRMFSQYGIALRFSKDDEVKGEIAFPP